MKRQANIELLRIIAMLYILLHHLIVHALCPNILPGKGAITVDYAVYSIMEGFLYVAVNIFLLISGYFGIRLRARKIWSLYLQCAFYGFCTYLFGVAIGSAPLVPHTFITKSLLIFSHASSWWFVALYFMLMIISPFLNHSMQMLTKKQYLVALIGMTFVLIYLGWFWQKSIYDIDGYSLVNFIYIYLIGGYLRRFVSLKNVKKARVLSLGIYAGCALIFGGCNILRLYTDIPFGNLWGYNNPIVISGAIGLFLFVRSFKFESNIVNYIGGGVFASYLLTDINYTGNYLYKTFGDFAQTISVMPLRIVMLFVVAIVLLLMTCGIDLLRARMMRPISGVFDWIDNKVEN